MTQNLRTTALSIAAGGTLTVLGLLFGPAGSASAAEVDIHLDATTGTTSLPSNGGTTNVPVWGYCRRTDPAVACGPVSAPGGPVLTADVGDVVHVTLHNTLAEATSLYVGGQAMVPDTTGAAAGASKTYTFTASRPGTYLYEAGLTTNNEHQVAMGLYGALVVRPATAGQAYDASTAYDAEAVLVLSEIDPALNGAADPAAFDMRNFKPRWGLINGKAHPATDPIPATSGQSVLLRWVNAGSIYHSMAVLGADQRFVALDGSQQRNGDTDISRRYVAETMGPGQSADAIVTLPTTATDRRLAVYDASLTLHNTNAPGAGGMLTFLEVSGAGTTTDTAGPATTGVAWENGVLTATGSENATGGADIAAAEYYLDSIAGTPTPMNAVDGGFDSPTEAVTLSSVDIATGRHILYVRAQDSLGNWGPLSSVLVMGADDQGPTTTGVTLAPDRTNGASDITITATANDSASGNSAISGAEWAIDGGTATAMSLATSGPVASIEGTIPATTVGQSNAGLAEGNHVVTVRSQDSAGNWGDPVEAVLVIDRTGPSASNVSVTPNPNNGTMPVNGSSPAVRLSATLTDPASGDPASPAGTAQSSVVKAEAFIDQASPGAPGSGIPLEAADGAFTSPTENVYLDIPLTTVRQMSDGPHTLSVRGKDAAGNWGDLVSTTLTVDKTGPAVTGLTLTPNPTNGATTVSLTATVVDALSSVSTVEWFVGTDPGVGNGASVTPGPGGTVSAMIDTSALAEGASTVTVRAIDSLGNRSSAAQQLQVRRPLWFSTLGNTNPPGVGGNADDSDIYSWSGTAMSRTIDMSTAPYNVPGSANLDGFSRVDATHFYVSFAGNLSLSGVGSVADEDVLYWTGTGWQMYFDGSTHGVSTDLDAISIRGGSLYFSTDNNTAPPGVSGGGDDADIYRWNGGSSYTRVVDATAIGLPNNANVDGFVWAGTNDWLFSFSANNTNVPTLGAIADEDVVRRINGTWTVYFDGSAHGMTAANLDIDAFDIP